MSRTDDDLRAMAADSVKRARAKIDMTGVCDACRAVTDTWWKNLPRLDRQWPGGDQGCRHRAVRLQIPGREITVGPFLLPFHPRMGTGPAFQHVADWDVRNAEQIALCADICRAAGHTAGRCDIAGNSNRSDVTPGGSVR